MKYIDPKHCKECGYQSDCEKFWDYCPYNGCPKKVVQAPGFRVVK